MTLRSFALPALPALALSLVLGGCATVPTGPAVPAAEAEARQAARERRLHADTAWGLEGRLAVSTGDQGGSGRIEWRQDGPRYDVLLSAPITRQGWRLTGAPGSARLDGIEGGPRTGTDAGRLLLEATRWDIPVQSLPDWLRGLPTPGRPAQLRFGADGRLARIEQDGWTIDYAWPADATADRPARIDARRDPARVRLAIDRWTVGAE